MNVYFFCLCTYTYTYKIDIGLIVLAGLLCLIGCNGCICGAVIGAFVKKFLESEVVMTYKANLHEFDRNISIFIYTVNQCYFLNC